MGREVPPVEPQGRVGAAARIGVSVRDHTSRPAFGRPAGWAYRLIEQRLNPVWGFGEGEHAGLFTTP